MKRTVLSAILCLACIYSLGAADKLTYSMSYNLGFIWINGGEASLTTENVIYEGKPAVKTTLTAWTTPKVDKIVSLRDTISSITGLDNIPLRFEKHCVENGDYVNECSTFTRTDKGYEVHITKKYADGHIYRNDTLSVRPVFDMISFMMYARKMEPSDLKKGERLEFPMVGSKRVHTEVLLYCGLEDNCHVFKVVKPEKDKGKSRSTDKDVMLFYIRNDKDLTPVQIDFLLKIGAAKVKMKS